jgi:terminase small subunit / prophage DNA-packing protein
MATQQKGQQVNRAGLAAIFGVALTTIDTWVKNGCPVVQRGMRGVEWAFDTAAVGHWRTEYAARRAVGDAPDDMEKLELRKAKADTVKAELELAKAAGEVAPVADFEKATARLMATIRTNLLNIPARAALRLLGETDETAFKRILREELVMALETSAEEEVVEYDDEGEEIDGETE